MSHGRELMMPRMKGRGHVVDITLKLGPDSYRQNKPLLSLSSATVAVTVSLSCASSHFEIEETAVEKSQVTLLPKWQEYKPGCACQLRLAQGLASCFVMHLLS
jgi:hypothetical protein